MTPSRLVLGNTGYLGRNLLREFVARELDWFALPSLDLTTTRYRLDYSHVINCVGLADMDRAETDATYRSEMVCVNAGLPVLLRHNSPGHFTHISTPFAVVENHLSYYSRTKAVADELLAAMIPESLIVYPGWLYGGIGSTQIDAVLNEGLDKPLTIDNVRKANPTPIDAFCRALVDLIEEGAVGRYVIYREETMTAAQVARELFGIWGEQWTVGKYHDVAKRPADWTYNDRFDDFIHLTVS